ncbi:Pre-mRNA-processing ATP-dependent RNA helicase prp5 [Babesia ovata]|uniref:Pre-mRNA-processing ATP-dependent RNA helicase prp5 n=1 Tax=Babesia ovata TaxID=189622 RepID=A0A2H6K9D9_9APIC|nr:Pre-mRNA-processing ATP-dependent RNA helicase prp5 [Babesia ovata]GBE59601.1 Pre-mRNA-processing ATP-dependent RNA helicase prp5 [Babesia ovata]
MKTQGWRQKRVASKHGSYDRDENERDAALPPSSELRNQEVKGHDHMDYRQGDYYGGSSRRRYDDGPSDGYRRQYDAGDHGRHHRYGDRNQYAEPRVYRNSRYDRRTFEDERDHYQDSRYYRGGRYDDHHRYRRSGGHYDDRDQYDDRYDRYDRYHRSGRSYSPQTPFSDRRSPNVRKGYYSPPPSPPADAFMPPEMPPTAEPSAARSNQRTNTGPGNSGSTSVSSTAHGDQAATKSRDDNKKSDGVHKGDVKVVDPRGNMELYDARMVTTFDLVTLPRVAPADASLASPPFDMRVEWRTLKPAANGFSTPIERINNYMCAPKTQVFKEWWLKGTLSLLMMGIPRQWQPQEVLSYIMDAYDRLLDWDDILDESNSNGDVPLGAGTARRDHVEWCKQIGLRKFILLFGHQGIAVNEIPMQFRRTPETSNAATAGAQSRTHTANEQPDAMALLVFESETHAMQFWAAMASNCIKAYPSTIVVAPDPSGWRIYTEAIALWFNGEAMGQVPAPQAQNNVTKDKQNDDLLPVLTNKSQDEAAPKQKPLPQLTFVSPYVSNPEDANEIANALAKIGIRCMYHKPSKIMSLQFPNETLFSSLAVCHRFFTSPSGSRVHCCFIRCLDKFLPLVKRTNVEHLSNAVEKSKTAPPKPCKFKPPSVGIITIECSQ